VRYGIFRFRPFGDRALAVGANGGIFELNASGEWIAQWSESSATPDCVFEGVLDGGQACAFGDVIELPDSGFLAVGHYGDNTGVLLLRRADGRFQRTNTGGVRNAVTRLPDGGVFVCGWDGQTFEGDPEALVSHALTGINACFSVVSLGDGTLVVGVSGGVAELRFDTFDDTWARKGGYQLDRDMFSVHVVGSEIIATGASSTIVRVKTK
jgi:hypothetical protein